MPEVSIICDIKRVSQLFLDEFKSVDMLELTRVVETAPFVSLHLFIFWRTKIALHHRKYLERRFK